MSEAPPPDPLARLGERLDRARRTAAPPAPPPQGAADLRQGMSLALRIGMELVVAVVVGAGIGWAIDRGLGTQPWALLVLLLLGFGAGLLNVYRAVARIGGAVGLAQRQAAQKGAAAAARQWDEDEK